MTEIGPEVSRRLLTIINLLAMQIVDARKMNQEESIWLMKQCGMENKEIAELLNTKPEVVRAAYSTKKKKVAIKNIIKKKEIENGK
jgi:DNA-binding NarL/FixJ family response regulator